jgi:hypothetical protein
MTTTHPSANDSGLNLDHLEALPPLLREILTRHDESENRAMWATGCGQKPDALMERVRTALANQPAPTAPVAWRDALRRSGATDHHGRIAFLPAQLEQFVSMLTAHQPAQEQAEPLNGGMHDSIFVKVWGDAGGGDAGRRALAQYAFDLGKQSAQQEPVAAPQQAAAPGELAKSARALAEKWHKDAVDTGFATSEAAVELLEVLDAATSAPGTPEAPSDKHLPGWERGITTVTMNGHQLREALDFINPDGDDDEDQRDNDLTFGIVQHKDDDGNAATGLCCWNDDTDGVLPLDSEPRAVQLDGDQGEGQ